ncbi:MAG: hypothetical protein RJB43_1256 [Verrucomicrobiota bacterium]
MRKIVVTLEGGLGNQMFQYAAARAAAVRTSSQLALDIRPLSASGERGYSLGAFRLREPVELVTEGPAPRRNGRIRNFLNSLLGGERHFRESGFRYDPAVLRINPSLRMEGYFQSERYFADIASVIREDFTPREDLLAEINLLAEKLIPSGPCVSLHVRRGDYTNPATMAVHGLLDAPYYEKGLRLVAERIGQALPICVFTDDSAWVRANLGLPGELSIISEHTRSPLQDLILMSRCTHHITANSSFSWWGAWLNPSQDKIVVTPARWFQPDAGLDTKDLRPDGWIQA